MKIQIGDLIWFKGLPSGKKEEIFVGYCIKSDIDYFTLKWINDDKILQYSHYMNLKNWNIEKIASIVQWIE